MPATFTPIGNDVLSGMRAGDEGALERLFREHYDALIDEAKGELDDPVYAYKVVETAVLRAWMQRAEFTTPEELERFLHKAVHEGAVRDRARRAGIHRFDARDGAGHSSPASHHHHIGMTSVDEAWAHVQAILHAPPPDARHNAELMAAHSRHAAAEHVAQVAKQERSPLVTAAYGIGAIALVAALFFALFRDTPDKRATRLLASEDAREIISRSGQIGNATLDDGSRVTLGADSKLRIPPGFGDDLRVVAVNGTASFDVAQGKPTPFQVRAGTTTIAATGTKFAVSFDSATAVTMARVLEGSVDVRAGERSTAIAAGKALVVDATGAVREPTAAERDASLGWTDGRFVVTNRPLREALDLARRWYGLTIVPADASLLDRAVTVDARLESSKEMIADLEESGRLKFGWEDTRMMLYDVAHAPAEPAKRRK